MLSNLRCASITQQTHTNHKPIIIIIINDNWQKSPVLLFFFSCQSTKENKVAIYLREGRKSTNQHYVKDLFNKNYLLNSSNRIVLWSSHLLIIHNQIPWTVALELYEETYFHYKPQGFLANLILICKPLFLGSDAFYQNYRGRKRK